MFNLIASTYFWAASKVKATTGSLGGNAKVFIATQLFFSVPAVWFATYWALFLVELGAGKEYIGYLASILIAVQVLVSFFSVFISERFGHKHTYIAVSVICWPAAIMSYALSGNALLASLAIIVNNMFMLADPSFVFLFIKGIKKEGTHSAFAVLNILFTGASFFSPVAGFFIKKLGIIDGGRLVFIAGSVMMSLSLAIRAFLIEEPAGHKQVKHLSFKEYKKTFISIVKNSYFVRILILDTLMMFNMTVINTYSAIYLTDRSTIALDSSLISYFPSINAVFNIIVSLLIVPGIKIKETKKYLRIAMLAGILAWGILLLAPKGNFLFVAVTYAFHGLWFALYFPLIMGLLLSFIGKARKEVYFSVFNVFALSASIPAGAIAGKMYVRDPKLPFMLVTFIFAVTLLAINKILPVTKGIKRL